MKYDAIIVGASFAGLAVANQLKGNVLLIDRKGIGEGQTSACGTLLGVLERLGLEECLLQVHPSLFFHTSSRTEKFDVSDVPFCTFDYGVFCREMASHLDAEVLQAPVKGLIGNEVVTEKGVFKSKCLIDASGWRAVLATSLHGGLPRME